MKFFAEERYHDYKIVEDPRDISKRVCRAPKDLIPVFNQLKEIIEIPSAPGFEQGIDLALVDIFKRYCDKVVVDHNGNVYGKIEGEPGGPKIVCPAHIDSVSYIVESIEESGYIRFANVGLIPPYLPYVQRMLIITPDGPITGVVGSEPGHMNFNYGGGEGKYYPIQLAHVPTIDNQFVDIGARSRKQALDMGVRPGQQMVYDRDLQWLGDGSGGMVTCRGLDDKAGVVVLIEALKHLQGKKLFPTVYMVGAAQEEIGSRGAAIVGNYVDADLSIGVDGSISESGPAAFSGMGLADWPQVTRSEIPASMGDGVGIGINDVEWGNFSGLMSNQRLNERLVKVAKENGIIYQLEGNMPYITTDNATLQFQGFGGTPSTALHLPLRYTHGPVEAGSLFDIQQGGLLLAKFIESYDKTFDFSFVKCPEADGGYLKRRERF